MNLELAGYACGQAFRGDEVPRLLTDLKPHLILLDISLPDIEGYELLPQFEQSGLPVIILTARNGLTDKIRVQAFFWGSDRHFFKSTKS